MQPFAFVLPSQVCTSCLCSRVCFSLTVLYLLSVQPFETRRDGTHHLPPPADTPLVVRDRGSAGPGYLRSSVNHVPNSAEMLKTAALPFVIVVTPLALPDPRDDPVEVGDEGRGFARRGKHLSLDQGLVRFWARGATLAYRPTTCRTNSPSAPKHTHIQMLDSCFLVLHTSTHWCGAHQAQRYVGCWPAEEGHCAAPRSRDRQ